MMASNLFVIANVKQLRTDGSCRILLPSFRTSWGVGVLNSAIFNSFHNRVEFGTILEGLRNFGGWEAFEPPKPSPRYATDTEFPKFVWTHLLLEITNKSILPGIFVNFMPCFEIWRSFACNNSTKHHLTF